MSSETECKVWIRFESKKQNGENIKLRIQDLPLNRLDEFVSFYIKYFINSEAFHKAAGVGKNIEVVKEYTNLLTSLYRVQPPLISICCLDDDTEDFDTILGISAVSNEIDFEDGVRELGIELKSKEIQDFVRVFKIMESISPKYIKEKYKSYHEGRGIVVHPDYRGLGIANELVKQRRMLLEEYKVPMSYAWMTAIASQKAAERNGWETVAEVTLEELDKITGLCFVKDVPTFKLMLITLD